MIKDLFKPQADGVIHVAFHDGHTVEVHPLTDAQIVLGSNAGEQGLWLNTLEEGIGKLLKRLATSEKSKPLNALDIANRGGGAGPIMSLLTGHHPEHLHLNHKKPLTPAEQATLMEQARAGMPAPPWRSITSSASTPAVAARPNMPENHCYAILDFKSGGDTVRMWNPWGTDFTPKGVPGPTNGYPTKAGEFEIPLKELLHLGGTIVYNTDLPATEQDKKLQL